MQTKRPWGWQPYGASRVSIHVTHIDTATHNNSRGNPPPPTPAQKFTSCTLNFDTNPLPLASGLVLNFSVFLISRNFSSVTYFPSLHFRHAIPSSQYFVRCFFSYFLRDPVGSISVSHACVEIYYANQPDIVTSLTLSPQPGKNCWYWKSIPRLHKRKILLLSQRIAYMTWHVPSLASNTTICRYSTPNRCLISQTCFKTHR
jgi:hypothetical protein